MAHSQTGDLLQHLRRLVGARSAGHVPDQELLERFVRDRDEAAFAALVRRHGAMVLGVCRRVLRHAQDAEDACQATFLVLARKADAVRKPEAVGSWLHGVARRLAGKARAAEARRRDRESRPATGSHADPTADVSWREVQGVLDQELARLPEHYRAPLVLCYLEGQTRDEAAQQLGWTEGTLRGRLERGREMLRQRLTRRGLTLSAALLGTGLALNTAAAAVPGPLAASTAKAALLLATGQPAAGVISTKVIALTEGVLHTMWMTKLKVTATFLLIMGLLGAGGSALVHRTLAGATPDRAAAVVETAAELTAAQEPARDQARTPREQQREGTTVAGALQDVDADKHSVTISTFTRQTGVTTDRTIPLAKDAKILRDNKEAKLADLKKGGRATLRLSPDEKTVVSLSITGATMMAPLKAVDAAKNTLTITVENRQGKQDKTYPVAKDAKVMVDGKEAKLADLKAGITLSLTLSAEDGNTLIQIQTPRRRGNEGEEQHCAGS